jgi:hypothetical protein
MRSALAAVRQPNGAADAQAAVERLLPSGELA